MHLVPSERAHRRIIDSERVCTAITAIEDESRLRSWSNRFGVLADPTRLKVLLCIKAAGPISVSDLAVAADLNDDTTSQALRHLRASQVVATQRDGRIVRYTVVDPAIEDLLNHAVAPVTA
jgi:DNA-binding transcriptional ArsR family regulator